jgi:hypothetical protein
MVYQTPYKVQMTGSFRQMGTRWEPVKRGLGTRSTMLDTNDPKEGNRIKYTFLISTSNQATKLTTEGARKEGREQETERQRDRE